MRINGKVDIKKLTILEKPGISLDKFPIELQI